MIFLSIVKAPLDTCFMCRTRKALRFQPLQHSPSFPHGTCKLDQLVYEVQQKYYLLRSENLAHRPTSAWAN